MVTTPFIHIFFHEYDKGISTTLKPGLQHRGALTYWLVGSEQLSCVTGPVVLSKEMMTGCLLTQVGARIGRSSEI